MVARRVAVCATAFVATYPNVSMYFALVILVKTTDAMAWVLLTVIATVPVIAVARPSFAVAVGPAVHLDRNFALVNDCVAHASTVAFVAGAHAVDTRAVRSAAISPVAANAFDQ